MSAILESVLRIQSSEVSFVRRRFNIPRTPVRTRLERVGETFLYGYHAALADRSLNILAAQLNDIDLEFRSYGYEGAAMALDLLDQLTPWKRWRVQTFLAGSGEPHTYMVLVGIGWSMARIRFRLERRLSNLDPLLRWLAIDGYGFHEGYFHWQRYIDGKSLPSKLQGYALRAFDQGLGRSMWFIAGADPERIIQMIEAFPDSRRGDLWSGVGLACAYAGGAGRSGIDRLRQLAGYWWPHLAQGTVFAAKARARAGNPTEHTDQACRMLCGLPCIEAAALSDLMLIHAVEDGQPAYEVWRRHIRMYFHA